jgi:polar amino acid transport system permease protein
MPPFLQLLQFGSGGWSDELLLGAAMTIAIAIAALPLGLAAGLALAFAIHSRQALLRESAGALAGVFRGIPELLALFIVYIGGQRLLNLVMPFLGLDAKLELSGYLAGVLSLGIVFGAYASAVFLGILRTLDGASVAAAQSLGLGRWPILRFIIFPELFRLGLPGLSNLWLSTMKQTALVSVVAGDALMRKSYLAASSTGAYILFFGAACLIYFAITSLSEAGLAAWHRRLSRGRDLV